MRSQIFGIWHQLPLQVASFCLWFDVESRSNWRIGSCEVCFVDDGLRWDEFPRMITWSTYCVAAWAFTSALLSSTMLDKRSDRSKKWDTTRVTIWSTKEYLSSMLSYGYRHTWCRSPSQKFRYDENEMAWVRTVRWSDTSTEVYWLLRRWSRNKRITEMLHCNE